MVKNKNKSLLPFCYHDSCFININYEISRKLGG